MSSAWDYAENLSEKHANQGGMFIRLVNNGDKVVGAFCGEPHAREVHWTGERYEECTGDGCAHCAGGKKPSLRVMLNFYVPAEGAMMVYETGTRVFRDILKLRAKYGLQSWMFEIERHGEKGSSKTRYSVLPEAQLDAELKAQIAQAELHDLAGLGERGDDGADAAPEPATAASSGAGGATFPTEAVAPLVARLKALPRSDVDTFLGRFRISRVRDLAATEEQAAYTLLEQLEARHAPPPAADEIDPFA